MSQTMIREGRTMPYINESGATISSGTAVVVGTRVGIAINDIPDGETGALCMHGVHELPKTYGEAATQGGKAYIKASGEASSTASGNVLNGYFFADAETADEIALVAINTMNA